MPATATTTEVSISIHSVEAEWPPWLTPWPTASLTASPAPVANIGSSQVSKVRNPSPNIDQSLGTPNHPASTLPTASTPSTPVIDTGDSWTCVATSGATRDLP